MHAITAVRAEFEPPDLQGCLAWLRADRDLYLSGNNVITWKNQVKSTASSDASGTDATAPTRGVGVNNLPKVVFAGANNILWPFDMPGGTKTFLSVFRLGAEPGTGSTIWNTKNKAGFGYDELLLDLAAYAKSTYSIDQTLGSGGTGQGFSDALGTTNVHCELVTYNGVDAQASSSYGATLDGATKTIANSGPYGFTGSEVGAIGSRSVLAGARFYLTGDIYELAMWNRVLSVAELNQVWGYVKARYSISS